MIDPSSQSQFVIGTFLRSIHEDVKELGEWIQKEFRNLKRIGQNVIQRIDAAETLKEETKSRLGIPQAEKSPILKAEMKRTDVSAKTVWQEVRRASITCNGCPVWIRPSI
jgi:hypothetical protein